MAACKNFEPQVIFTELTGKDLDGLNLVRTLRRSTLSCRQAPVIVVTTEATAAAIVASRNAGGHEFLRKPFTTKDLVRRLEAVCLRSRDWIEAINYIGPDRRRFNSGDYQGPRKRQSDHPAMADAARRLHERRPVDGVLCWDEARILPASHITAALGLRGGGPEVIARVRDKGQTRAALDAAGVPQPRSYPVTTLDDALDAAARVGYPAILKPRGLDALGCFHGHFGRSREKTTI